MTDKPRPSRPRLRLVGIVFAFALNTILVSLVLFATGAARLDVGLRSGLALVAAAVAGLTTALYVGRRAAIHAFAGGLASALLLALFVLEGNWSFAVLAGSFCAAGGILGEFVQRRSHPT